MTDTNPRDLIQRLTERLDHLDSNYNIPCQSALIAEALDYLDQPEPEVLEPGYIDPEHKGQDRKLLEVFYKACRSEGGSADEIYLRGLKAVIALSQPEPEEPTDEELHDLWLELHGCHAGPPSEEVEVIARAVLARWGRPAVEPETNGQA